MVKYNLIVADPPWSFSDKLTMSEVKRGAEANYSVLSDDDIVNLNVESIAADNAVLALWVPSSKLSIGLSTMSKWGFTLKQTFIWVKVKQSDGKLDPLKSLHKLLKKSIKGNKSKSLKHLYNGINDIIENYDINDVLSMYLGRLFRQTHEIALIGTRGSVYKDLKSKSQRSVILDKNLGHSSKPEGFQDRLDQMFPDFKKLEMFARRNRPGWTCIGDENFSTKNEDIRDSIIRLAKI